MVVPTPQPRASRSKLSGVVVPHAPTLKQRLAAWLAFVLVRAVAVTLRYKLDDRSGYYENRSAGPAIYAAWHNRLALSMIVYHRYIRPRNRTAGLAAMVSASRDGGLLAAILERFKVQPVRGSTSRRGPQALLELTSLAVRGHDLAITPDGPRGPCYVVQDGVMSLAQLTGLPILPVSYHLSWKIRPRSWDRFQIPLPFSRFDVIFEKPIHIPREASDSEREVLRQHLEQVLKDISRD